MEVDAEGLADWLADGRPTVLIDIREVYELAHGVAQDALLIPMNQVPDRLDELPAQDVRVVVYCAAGVRSYPVTGFLRAQGWDDTWSLVGGFGAYLQAGGTSVEPDLR